MTLPLRMIFPDPCLNVGIGHIAASLCRHLSDERLEAKLIASTMSPDLSEPCFLAALPRWANGLPFRIIGGSARRRTERLLLDSSERGGVVWLWSGISQRLLDALQRRRVRVIREKYNCHANTARRILQTEYERLGFRPDRCRITDDLISRERAVLRAADAVFSPSPCVTRSLMREGVDARQILESTYGWSPERFQCRRAMLPRLDGVTVVFVGSVCIRKGAHILLDAWAASRIRGRLVLCGRVEPALAKCRSELFNRSDVLVTGPQRDVGGVYRSGDLFAFPSLEEGSPLVTFEAMAHGLPMLVSPMAAGSVVRDGVDGSVVSPRNLESWVVALRRLSADKDLRRAFGENARARADEFTWAKVAARRRRQILDRFAPPQTLKSKFRMDDSSRAAEPIRRAA